MLGYRPQTRGTALAEAVESATRVMKHSGIVFVISDLVATNYSLALKRLARRNDVVAIHVSDHREMDVPVS